MHALDDLLEAVEGNSQVLADLQASRWHVEGELSSASLRKRSELRQRRDDIANGYDIVYGDMKKLLANAGVSSSHNLEQIMSRISSAVYNQAKNKYEKKLSKQTKLIKS